MTLKARFAALAGLAGCFLPAVLAGQISGRAEVGLQSYDDSLPGLSARGLFADTSFFLPAGGELRGTLNLFLDDQNSFRAGRNALELREIPWGGARFTAAAGDLFESLDRPGLRFSNDFNARPLFRGVSLMRDSPSWTLSLFGGRNEQLVGSLLPTIAFAPESFAGTSAAWRPIPGWTVDFSALAVHNKETGAASIFGLELPRQAENLTGGLTAALAPGLQAEGRLTYSHSDTSTAAGLSDRNFLSFLAGGLYQSPHWRIETNYIRYGVDYAPLSTLYSGNREGPFAQAGYVSGRLSATGSYQEFRSNPDGVAGVQDFRSTSSQLATFVTVGRSSSVGLTYSDQQLSTPAGETDFNSRLRRVAAQTSVATYGTTLVRLEHDDNFTSEGNRRVNEIDVQHFLSLQPVNLSAGVRFQRDDQGDTSTVYLGSIDASFSLFHVYFSGEWGNDLAGGSVFTENRNRTLTYGASASLPAQLQLHVEGYRNRTDSFLSAASAFVNPGVPIASFNRSTFLIRLTRVFRWGTLDAARPIGLSEAPLPYGDVTGFVFADLNGNGVRDAGEPAVPGILVRLDDGLLGRSGPDGRYTFHNVIEGDHTIQLMVEDLPVSYNPPARAEATVHVERLRAGTCDFGLVLLGRIVGRVEQVLASGEHVGLDGAIVTLRPSDLSSYADENGDFVFANLAPGRYSVQLEVDSLPDGAASADSSRDGVVVVAGKDTVVEPFLFTLTIEEKPIKEIFQKDQVVPAHPRARPKPKSDRPSGSAAARRKNAQQP